MQSIRGKRLHHIVRSFEAQELKKRPFVVRIADYLTSGFGTLTFLAGNVTIYIFWILMNEGKIQGFPVIDPYPYSFMNSFVSIEAIILSIIVLMSQKRQAQRDTLRNELALQVEMISEQEITKILTLLKELLAEKGKLKDDPELEEMTKVIDAGYIERKLTEQLESPEESPVTKLGEKIRETISSKS